MLLDKIKSIVGEVNASHFKDLMLERSDNRDRCPYFYYDGTNYFTLERPGGPEVKDESVGPGDIINVEWKKTDETFSDYVKRKIGGPAAAEPAAEPAAEALSEAQKAEIQSMDKAMTESPAAAEPETKDVTASE